MVGRDVLFAVIERALECSPGDQTEVLIQAADSYLTRFSGNAIHQNVGERDHRLTVRVVLGRRLGRASTNSLSDQAVREAVNTAARLARLQPPNEHFRSLPSPAPVRSVAAWDEFVAECPAPRRADTVRSVVDLAATHNLAAAGAFATSSEELAVGNSLGLRAYHPYTVARLNVVVDSGKSTGYGQQVAHHLDDLNPAAIAAQAVDTCLLGRGATAVEPGEYEVILQPYATAVLVGFLARMAFSGQAYLEGRSVLAAGGRDGAGGKLGEQLVSDRVSLWDDGLDRDGMPLPFDFEGVPKRRLALLDRGVAANLCYDSLTAGRAGRESTGHAGLGRGWGPMPLNLFMAPGEATLEEMVASTDRGLLVTRFHYTNAVHPLRTMITGMTRDGTFLVEGGRVVRPVRNLRFGESIVRSLQDVRAVGRDRRLIGGGRAGAVLVPALKLGGFRFTGVTEF